ncbi:MAG: SpoIIE family protein phosphatase [Candidatus Omnitrophica bacterium]|nr:SpoIIE family protein phosphatase [Candidatus Omnitrophota bacterium]MCM8791478.1 SpoIIE family protein phosphatase [Candidatus Omnitrophota bacterium]
MVKKIPLVFRSFRVKVTIFFIVAMLFSGSASNFLVYRYALDSQFEQLRDKLMTIARIAALRVDAEMLKAIPLNKSGMESGEYKAIAAKLAEIKRAIPSIKYLYVLARTAQPAKLQFVVDADSGTVPTEPPSYPGDEYDASPFPEMLKGFYGPAADKKLGADRWGVFLSGYAPVRDRDGKAIAVLGVDMTAQDVHSVQREVRRRLVFVFAFGMLLAVMFGVLVSGGVTRQVQELMKGARRISQGDLEYKVKIKGADEIAQLAHLFNRMSSDLKRHIEELKRTTAEKERLLRELEIAKGIQQSFLPESPPKIPGIDIAAISIPARVVGGDFYDFIPIDADRWGIVIADVSGKGVPAALFMALSRTLVRASASGTTSPADAINHANSLILKDSKTNMFVTLFYAVIDASTMTLTFANAGHNPPLLISGQTDSIVLLKAQGVPLGITSGLKLTDNKMEFKKGDCLVLYTDGVTEAIDEDGEQFEIERLEEVVAFNRSLDAKSLIDKIQEQVTLFVGDQPQFDDITTMVIKVGNG